MADSEPEPRLEVETAPADSAQKPTRRRRAVWPWLLLIVAAVIGLGLGAALGVRERGPLAAPAAAGTDTTRPTIVIARPSPVASPAISALGPGRGSPVPAASPVAASDYVVEPSDTLRSISERVYGDPELWSRVYEENRDTIGPDPDALQPGTRLRIPSAGSQ